MKKLLTTATLLATVSALTAQSLINADITTNTIWGDDESEVVLDGPIYVTNNATLTILPGTIVRGQPRRAAGDAIGDAPGSLIISRDGRIEALGLSGSPIIFTTAAIDNDPDGPDGPGEPDGIPDGSGDFFTGWTPGQDDTFYDENPATSPLGLRAAGPIPGNTDSDSDLGPLLNDDNTELWGGLIILGEAPTNFDNGTGIPDPGQAYIEGLPQSNRTLYGGRIANDDSGILQYVSVRHGGDEVGTGNEINGITLGGVGFGTIIEYCEVYLNYDDGFEWFGGTVNGNHLMVSFVGDDSFDGDQGWIGQVQYAFAVQSHIRIGVTGGDEGFEFDGDDADEDGSPINVDGTGEPTPSPSYAFANFTIVGPTGATGYTASVNGNVNTAGDANGRVTLRNGFIGDLYNGYVVNATGSFLSYSATSALIDTISVHDTTDSSAPTGSGLVVANFVSTADGTLGLNSEDQNAIGGLDPRPVEGFLTPGITSTISLPAPFKTEAYVGAFSTDTNENLWTEGWTALNLREILVD